MAEAPVWKTGASGSGRKAYRSVFVTSIQSGLTPRTWMALTASLSLRRVLCVVCIGRLSAARRRLSLSHTQP